MVKSRHKIVIILIKLEVGHNSYISVLHFRCDCFFKLYKLGISVIYKSLKCFKKDSNRSKCICKKGLQVLSLLSYHSYDLTHKYDKDIAQFKEIVYLLSEICDKEEFKIRK